MKNFKFLVTVPLFSILTQVNAETFYTAEALATPYDWTYNVPTAINDNGEIVGIGSPDQEAASSNINLGLYWSTPASLFLLSSYENEETSNSAAYDINNSGVIAGNITIPASSEKIGALWDRSVFKKGYNLSFDNSLTTLSTTIKSINDNDVFVGELTLSNDMATSFMYWQGLLNAMTSDEKYVFVNTVSNSDIAGGGIPNSGFTYNPNLDSPLSLYPVNGYYSIFDINDENTLLVQYNNLCQLKSSTTRSFGDSDYSCNPRALNNQGIAIGTSNQFDTENAAFHAFIYNSNPTEQCPSDIRDLNTLTVKDKALTLIEAVDINETGQIVAMGLKNGEVQPYLLQPSAEGEAIPFELDTDEDGILDSCDPHVSNIMAWLIPILYLLN